MAQKKHLRIVFLIASLIFLIQISSNANAQSPITHIITLPAGMTWCDDTVINGVFSQINALRSQNGVAALNAPTLGQQDAETRATQFAVYMQTHLPTDPGFNPHTGYDTTAASLGYNILGEDLAYLNTDPAYIVNVIWQDPLHLAAMLNTSANVAGVSCVNYNGTAYTTYEPGYCSGNSCGSAPAPSPQPVPTPTPTGAPTLDSEEWAFVTLINNYRAANGAGPLQVDMNLQDAAQWMSNDMVNNNYIRHTDSLGRSTGARLASLNYPYSPWGEDLAAGYSDAQDVFNGFATACDPDANGNCTYTHRQIMLSNAFTVLGIARASGANTTYGWYWAADFGAYVDQIITPGGTPTTPAPSVSSFTATPSAVSSGQSATLAWSVNGATSVSIDNGIGAVSGNGSSTVSLNRTTTFTLTASNSWGTTTASVTVSVSGGRGPSLPTAPTLTSASAISPSEVDLAWTASTASAGVGSYRVFRNGAIETIVSAPATSYADTGLAPNTSYTYYVQAVDALGNLSAASNSITATTNSAGTPGPGPGQSCPGAATGAFTGCYYSNTTLAGNPSLVRTDSQINFDWGASSPDPSLTPHSFSAGWAGYFSFGGGNYTFSATVSDGIRLYVDGSIVMDHWIDQAATAYTANVTLTQGTHLVSVQYYDHTGSATAHLTWQGTAPVGKAPSILSFTANPGAVMWGQPATLTWQVNGATSISIDNGVGDVSNTQGARVSLRQSTTYTLTASNAAGSTTAQTTVLVGSAADTQPPSTPTLISAVAGGSAEVDLTWSASTDNVGVAGYQISRNGGILASVGGAALTYADQSVTSNTSYTYTVAAFDAAGNYSNASNSLQVTTPVATAPSPGTGSCPAPAVGAFTGCYYNNLTLSGAPAFMRTDGQINFDWGAGSPAAAVTPGNFSARWQGYYNFNDGVYGFTAAYSDGMRVYIDGNLILNSWKDQTATISQARPTLTQGSHLVTVEYYEHSGSATAHLTWFQY